MLRLPTLGFGQDVSLNEILEKIGFNSCPKNTWIYLNELDSCIDRFELLFAEKEVYGINHLTIENPNYTSIEIDVNSANLTLPPMKLKVPKEEISLIRANEYLLDDAHCYSESKYKRSGDLKGVYCTNWTDTTFVVTDDRLYVSDSLETFRFEYEYYLENDRMIAKGVKLAKKQADGNFLQEKFYGSATIELCRFYGDCRVYGLDLPDSMNALIKAITLNLKRI